MKIWFARREQQGRPVPRLRASWHGMTAGLTTGLSAATLVSTVGNGEAALTICLAAWVALLVVFIVRPKQYRTDFRMAMGASAALMIASAIAYVALHGIGHGILLATTLGIAALALAHGLFAMRGSQLRSSTACAIATNA